MRGQDPQKGRDQGLARHLEGDSIKGLPKNSIWATLVHVFYYAKGEEVFVHQGFHAEA